MDKNGQIKAAIESVTEVMAAVIDTADPSPIATEKDRILWSAWHTLYLAREQLQSSLSQ